MKLLKLALKILLGLLTIAILILLFFLAPYIWNNWVIYPNLEKERADLWTKYKQPEKIISANEYKGVFHMHSYWSHDSRGKLDEILPAAKKAGYNFLFFSDHPRSKQDTFPRSYNGVYEGIIFEPGTETSSGLMVSPMDSVVLDWTKGDSVIINDVVNNHGLVLYVHTEKKHQWTNPDFQAMEIYNIHTDYLDRNDSLSEIVLNFLINRSKYHHWVFRELYDDQTEILANWDSHNNKRRIVGMAAVDAHNNQGIRAKYTTDGKVEWVGLDAETIEIKEPGFLETILLDEPDSTGWAFKLELDPYFISFNHVVNHVFSDTLTNFGIKNNLVSGHAFISFQSLAKADGFQYYSINNNNNVNGIMGDSVSVKSISTLNAVSPLPVQFQLVRNGKVIDTKENVYNYKFDIQNKVGNYRIVAKLFLDKKWISWIYTNPIYVY